MPLAQLYKADRMYEQPWLHSVIFTDAMDAWHRSLDGNKHAQVFATEDFFTAVYPMESKSMARQELKQFISEFRIPDKVVCNGAGEHTGKTTKFMQKI